MPTPELKTGQLEWDNENFINEVKDIIYRKLETIPTLESIKEHVISETILLQKILKVNLMLNSVLHSV